MKRFSHLFPPAESLEDDISVSRRALPGLFLAFDKMAGSEFMQQCHGAGRRIFKDAKEERGDRFRWSEFYEDGEINDLIDDLMVVIAWCFKDFDTRLRWLLDLINSNLAPPDEYTFEGEDVHAWFLTEAGLLELLRGLFSDFTDKLGGEDGRRRVEHRYGEKAFATLESVVRTLTEAD